MTNEQRINANRIFLIMVFLSILVFSPLLMGGVYYIDDFHRLYSGNVSYWVNNGRPLAYVLLIILNQSSIVSDLSPALLIIGLTALIATLSWISIRLRTMGVSLSALTILTIIFNPFMSQVCLYVYDSLGMLLSIALVLIATFLSTESKRKYFACGFILFLAAICFYQTSANYAFISLLSVLVLAAAQDKRKELTTYALGVAALLLALICYKFIIAPLTVTDLYNQTRSQLVPLNFQGLYIIVENMRKTFDIVLLAFPGYNLIPVAIIFFSGTVGCIKIALIRLQKHICNAENVLLIILIISSPFLVCLGIAGFLLFLKESIFFPRVLGAFSAALIFNVIIAQRAFPALTKFFAVLIVFNLLFSATSMTATFRAVVNQNNFENGIINSMRDALSGLPKNKITQISFIGKGPLSSDVGPAMHNYPLLKEILYSSFMENNDFSFYGLANRAAVIYPLVNTTESIKNYKPEVIIDSNCIYNLYVNGNTAIFNFEKVSCSRLDKFR
ncbi:glucosyltransferase domain-containing protein (plasmid) [Enterobacter bugandensis]|uniref:glucosyltransferase domain-containing protein n=1 Tax=Enterobacter bugandensis TaxID=881260 RepID=UPI00283AA557|nr:glucosyltransferase domain-containing protein [Enterobacter bugandensis]WMU75296.1 glucosyltransferase domain-containing protein [Enterobacter bugandensis]